VAEDEAVVAIDIESHLEGLGYEVVGVASSAEGALTKAQALKPDLVLMDIRLEGEIDGIRAAEKLRQSLGIPVVFLTAYADKETVQRAKTAGAHGYILKPFDEHDLNTTIEIALNRIRIENLLTRSRENLLAVLDAQRQGTVAIDAEGRLTLVSRAVQKFVGRSPQEIVGSPWQDALCLPEQVAAQIHSTAQQPAHQRTKIATEITGSGGHDYALEIEVADDPRAEGRFILFFYDVSEVRDLRRMLDEEATFENIVGESKPMQVVFRLIDDLAQVDSSVLVEGETGTGKELVARAIHNLSHRRDKPFLPVNCGGLSSELASSQFFGHRRGVFTGAVSDHAGLFEEADGGTLFLDEIGELPLTIQPALLRVLEDHRVARLGEARLREVDVRVIAATGRNLTSEIERNNFRSDLFYRIAVARVHLPALRERREDLPLLIRSFVGHARAKTGKPVLGVDTDAMRLLLSHSWPGNVRELRNAIEFAVIRARHSEIVPEDLPRELLQAGKLEPVGKSEPDLIRAALTQAGGNRRKAAELLGISRTTLYRRLSQHGIESE
jgi:PAS domain S-box-containing protein